MEEKKRADKTFIGGMEKLNVDKMTARELVREYGKATKRMYVILDTCEKENRERTKEEELEYQELKSYSDALFERAMKS